ncbi:hypothetical protein [Hirschia baltica]|uniref:Uncharacterized protein n=1 Tax=Hirschia baltica (strain ATCC 49814 / DSM 5838 / IFAM 1418) TaxID=582402 RepID=C6XRH6_HIRBI|nr:hypothetical protein [Hirschia baltica]ACT58808.1 conserved hypothetical protein [Hirschia baltica ATCC 49814]
MEILGTNIWAVIGFAFAAYAVVGNDALQTLGTFINSNRRLPWWVLYLFAVSILLITFYWGWSSSLGDVSWGKLDKTDKFPIFEVHWYHALPPMVLLLLTRFGIPVSTTFMVLATFATMSGMMTMLNKSLMGYAVAFATGGLIYAALAPSLERWFLKTADSQHNPVWVVLQWVTTGYLWGVWLIQDFANIFVYLPRNLPNAFNVGGEIVEASKPDAQAIIDKCNELFIGQAELISSCLSDVSIASRSQNLSLMHASLGMGLIAIFLLITFANRGGPVQKILLTKTSVTDIRSATVIDFIYATLLFAFSGNLQDFGIPISKVPMSTTWVFLGLIAGREFAIATIDKVRSTGATAKIVGMDLAKATLGIIISVVLALSMPYLAQQFDPVDEVTIDTNNN